MIQPCRSRSVISGTLAETYSDTTGDRRVRKLLERARRDVSFEAVLHANPHVVQRDADNVNILILVNLGDLLAPSIRFVEYARVMREYEDLVGRLGELDRRRIDVAGLAGLQSHLQIVVSGARHLDEFVARQLLDVLAALRGRGVHGRVLEDL